VPRAEEFYAGVASQNETIIYLIMIHIHSEKPVERHPGKWHTSCLTSKDLLECCPWVQCEWWRLSYTVHPRAVYKKVLW